MPATVTKSYCLLDPLFQGYFKRKSVNVFYNFCSNRPQDDTNIVTRENPLIITALNAAYNNYVSVGSNLKWDGGDNYKMTSTLFNDSTMTMIIGFYGQYFQDIPNANGGGNILDIYHGRWERGVFSYNDPSNVVTSGGDSASFMMEEAKWPFSSSTWVVPLSSYTTPTCPPDITSQTGPYQGLAVKGLGYGPFTLTPGGSTRVEIDVRFKF
ncbi:MAG: hypothetical protein ACLPX5_10630 [Dissulfurispiraceae bacterium]